MKPRHDQRPAPPAHATGSVEFVPLDDIAQDETFRLRAASEVTQLATSMGRLGQLAPIELRPWRGAGAGGPSWQVVSGFRRLAAVRMLARERVLARLHRDLPDDAAWDLALGEALLGEPMTADELRALRERLRGNGAAPWADELIDEALVRAPVAPELRERFHDFLNAAPLAAEMPAREEDLVAAALPDASRPDAPAVMEAPPLVLPAPPIEPDAATESPQVTGPAPDSASARGAEQTADAPGQGTPPQEAPPPFSPDEIVEVTPEELVQDLTARLYALNQDLATAFEAWDDLPVEGRRLLVEQARYVVALLPFMEARR